MSRSILGIIPARGGSKGIPKKNIKLLCGKPLLSYTAEAALTCKMLDRVVLSTENNEIANIGLSLGLEVPFMRSELLSQDDTPSVMVFLDVLEKLKKIDNYVPDFIVILQPTSPLRTCVHISESIDLLINNKDADSLVSITKIPHNMSPDSALFLDEKQIIKNYSSKNQIFQRQYKKEYYARNGAAIYIIKTDVFLKKKSLFGDKLIGYKMNKLESIDIDDIDDFTLAELILKNK